MQGTFSPLTVPSSPRPPLLSSQAVCVGLCGVRVHVGGHEGARGGHRHHSTAEGLERPRLRRPRHVQVKNLGQCSYIQCSPTHMYTEKSYYPPER